MAIEIHIRVRDRDWDLENKLAYAIAEDIQTSVIGVMSNFNIPILVIPVEDPENEMVSLIK